MLDSYDEVAVDLDSRILCCEERIGYVFSDRTLLKAALTHASGADRRVDSNERLEFLGDAIMGAVVCEALFRRFPHDLEGELTRLKSIVVSRVICARISRSLGMDEFLLLGKGMAASSHVPRSVMADVFESLVAAVFLDGGYAAAQEFVLRHVTPEIDRAEEAEHGGNYKSQLQHLVQKASGATPLYELLDEKGPDHSKCFKVAAQVGARMFAPAWGRNKKEAEQRAACNAVAEMQGAEPVFSGD